MLLHLFQLQQNFKQFKRKLSQRLAGIIFVYLVLSGWDWLGCSLPFQLILCQEVVLHSRYFIQLIIICKLPMLYILHAGYPENYSRQINKVHFCLMLLIPSATGQKCWHSMYNLSELMSYALAIISVNKLKNKITYHFGLCTYLQIPTKIKQNSFSIWSDWAKLHLLIPLFCICVLFSLEHKCLYVWVI